MSIQRMLLQRIKNLSTTARSWLNTGGWCRSFMACSLAYKNSA